MTTFTLPCEVFLRLAGVAIQPDETTTREYLRSVRIEHHNGKCFAIATNSHVIAGEFIRDVEGVEDDGLCITIVPALLELARTADNLIIAKAPGWTVITTDDGRMYPANGEIPCAEYPDWRGLVPSDLPTKNNGCFAFSGAQMARLCASAPSGAIRCAKHIDMSVPTIVRDTRDDSWFGVFMVTDRDKDQSYKPATIPEFLL